MTMHPVMQADNIGFSFGGAPLARGISFSVSAGEALIIGGRSGCGKSTLLELCACMRQPQLGEIFWEGSPVALFTHDELVSARQRMGFIFQKHALIHNITIFDNIALPLRYHSVLSEKEIAFKVRRCMDEVGLFNVDRKFPNELSAGQSKSAALARAIIMEPVMLFADEPTAGVDPYTAQCIANLLNYLREVKNMAVIMICNDMQTAAIMKPTLKILEEGALFDVTDTAAGDESSRSAILTAFRERL